MNSRERLLACLRGEIPDRVPVSTYELNGWNAANFENRETSYARLMGFIRENTDCIYMISVEVPNVRASDWEWRHEKCDEGKRHVVRSELRTHRGPLTMVQTCSDDLMTTWTREPLCKSLDDVETYLDLPWAPGEPDFSRLEQAQGDLAGTRGLPMLDMGDPVCEVATNLGLHRFTVLAVTETERMARLLDRLHERYVELVRRVLRGPVRDCLFRIYGPEYVTPPLLPPALFARFVTPYDGVYCRMMREAGVFARIHSHGRIARVLDEIVKMEPAALDPCEPPPDGDIELAALKKEIGGHIALMGGIELKDLEARDEAFVDRLVREAMAAGKPGGRFVLMPTAAPINIPLSPQTERNYIRWITTALEIGAY